MRELLALDRVTAGYGESVVLEAISLALQEGDSLGSHAGTERRGRADDSGG